MFELTLKELFAHRRRMLSTVFAVLLGVSLMAGTLILTDTLMAAGDSVMEEGRAGIDAMARAQSDVDVSFGQVGERIDASNLDVIRKVPGVASAEILVSGYAQMVDTDGNVVGDQSQAPAFGFNWVGDPSIDPFRIAEGRAPDAVDEIAIDRGSADEGDVHVGDRVTVLTQQEPTTFTVAGIATFGEHDSPAGATVVLFTDAAAQKYLAAPGRIDSIAIKADEGLSQTEIAERVSAAVPDLEVVTGATLVQEDKAAFHEDMGPFRVFMLVFAFVAVFVGAFMINNTFSITVAQRTRQLAMVRALGASRGQVLWSVMTEAVAIGVAGAASGLAAGIGLAAGFRAGFEALGIDLPDGGMVISPTSLAIAAGVGIAITVLSAWMPARRAGRIPPIAALRELAVDRSATSKRRTIIGSGLTAAGCAVLLAGLGGAGIGVVGLGAFVALGGVAVLGPVLARPVIGAFGMIVARLGIPGDMAVRNARRNSKRTARTASSLMIGVALVVFIAVFAASTKTSLAGSLEENFTGTHIVDSGGDDGRGGFSPALATEMNADPDVTTVTESRMAPAIVEGSETILNGFTGSTLGEVFDLGNVQGDLVDLGDDGVAVDADYAADHGWQLGSPVEVSFATGTYSFVVEAVFDQSSEWVGSYFVDVAAFDRDVPGQMDFRIYASGDDATIRDLAAAYPSTTPLDKAEFLDMVNGRLDIMLGVVYALLALAVLIALLGIANTLSLSIHERVRELGLLRAVGMTRRQLRAVVRGESVMIALFGTVLGLGIGSFFGWATVRALADEGVDEFAYPVGNLLVVTVVACLAGAMAAIGPARRAARLDVLDAITAPS